MDQLERNKEVVRRAWAAFDACDEAAFAACVTADWREHDAGGVLSTIADANAAMRLHRAAFSGKRTVIERIVAEGDLVVTHSRTAVTHSGVFEGIAPTGRRLEIEEMLINRIENGRIAESWQLTSGGFRALLENDSGGTRVLRGGDR